MPQNSQIASYADFLRHIGHTVRIIDVWDWHTNQIQGVELRCVEKFCEGSEPLLEIDNPSTSA